VERYTLAQVQAYLAAIERADWADEQRAARAARFAAHASSVQWEDYLRALGAA
jgi:hypothetical protein